VLVLSTASLFMRLRNIPSAQDDLRRISSAVNVIERFTLARKLWVGGTAIASWSFNAHQCYIQDRQVSFLVRWNRHDVELMVDMHHRRSKQVGLDLLESPTMAGPRSSSPCERLITLRPSLCWKSYRHKVQPPRGTSAYEHPRQSKLPT
jgi:hypothetical protein